MESIKAEHPAFRGQLDTLLSANGVGKRVVTPNRRRKASPTVTAAKPHNPVKPTDPADARSADTVSTCTAAASVAP